MTDFDLFLKLLLQLAVILAACRVVGAAGRRLGQPQVVGEMVTGVLLGPSLFGLLWPEAQEWLFPQSAMIQGVRMRHPSMSILYAVSQLGLVLYMFMVGLEFNTRLITGRIRSAGLVSGVGIAVPLVLGAGAAALLRHEADLFTPTLSDAAAMLYLGAAMSITAFPTLARILQEKRVAGTRLGTLTLAAGATDDAMAWCLLAVVLSSFKDSWREATFAIGGGGLYTLFMVYGARRLLRFLGRQVERDDGMSQRTMLTILLVCILCAWFTDLVGIYAVFGAFIAGAVMPRGRLVAEFLGRAEQLTTGLLLPVFFVFSGLNTRIGLVSTGPLWLITIVLTTLAIVGKGVACALAARLAGEPWRDALAIGTLMNARGLMELIILNIGLQQGVITPTLFTMMVLMAVFTTLMTSPLFDVVAGRDIERIRRETEGSAPETTRATQAEA